MAVVGAGVVGCAIAHELAVRGATVDLLDARGVGSGATKASAGILAPQIEGHTPALRQLAARSLALYEDFIRRVEHDAGLPVEHARTGTLQVACSDEEARALADDARALAEAGIDHRLLDRQAARAEEPGLSHQVVSALLVPSHGYVRAAQLTEALAQAARARGARLSTAAVLGIDQVGSRARVTMQTGTIEPDAVVVASGSWTIPMRPAEAPAVRPIRGQLVHLHAEHTPALRVIWGGGCYLVPWRDGSMLVGATVEDVGFDERSTADGVRGLLEAAVRLLPPLADAQFREVRVGLRPRAADELPIIGRSPIPGVFYALGHYRNGVLLAPLTAALLADLVLDGRERPEMALVTPERAVQG